MKLENTKSTLTKTTYRKKAGDGQKWIDNVGGNSTKPKAVDLVVI